MLLIALERSRRTSTKSHCERNSIITKLYSSTLKSTIPGRSSFEKDSRVSPPQASSPLGIPLQITRIAGKKRQKEKTTIRTTTTTKPIC
jgi:hypothetical protein